MRASEVGSDKLDVGNPVPLAPHEAHLLSLALELLLMRAG